MGQKCRFACRDPKRFKLVGSRGSRCQKNSEWKWKSEPPKCVEKDTKAAKAKKKEEEEDGESNLEATNETFYSEGWLMILEYFKPKLEGL